MKLLTYAALVSTTSAIKGKCPFGFTSGTKPGSEPESIAQLEGAANGVRYPSEMFSCPTAAVMKTNVDKFGDD